MSLGVKPIRLIDTNTGQVVESLGEVHSAQLESGVCLCGWTAQGSNVATETWDHLYGDLNWIPRDKLVRVTGPRP